MNLLIVLHALLILIIFTPWSNCYAIDLSEAYSKAKIYDPEYLSAYYEHRANLNIPDLAVAKLLPQVNASYSYSNYSFINAEPNYNDYSAEQRGLSLQQAVFNVPAMIELKQSDLRVKASEARLKNAEQNLIKRVSEAYFDLLYANDYMKVINEEKRALEETLKVIKRLFSSGEAALTDIHDAEARFYDVVYREVDAEKNLYARRKNLARLIGEEPNSISALVDDLPSEGPVPSEVQAWIDRAKEQNLVVRFYLLQKEITEAELKKYKAEWLPVLSFFSSYSKTNTRDYLYVRPLSYMTLGFQLNLNILNGGYITAKIRESRERVLQGEKEYEKALSEVSQGVVESFFGVKSALAGIASSRSSVRASELAMVSTKKGYDAGIRTFVDILNAESNLYKARLNQLKSTYDYIKNLVALYFYSGNLSDESIKRINSWLRGK